MPELYLAYVVFCRREGQFTYPQSTFTRRLPDQTRRTWRAPDGSMRQFTKRKSAATLYRGIRIKEAFRAGSHPSDMPPDREFAPRE